MEIHIETVVKIFNYLVNRPYSEVFKLIDELQVDIEADCQSKKEQKTSVQSGNLEK